MKGIVNRPLNLRQSPGVNAPKLGHFDEGDSLEIESLVSGDPFEDDTNWYLLKDGSYVWAGAVDLKPDLIDTAEEDKNQWIISYRQNKKDHRPDLGELRPADRLFFRFVKLPAENESINFNPDISPEAFVDGFMNSVRMTAPTQQHVFIYIHGYDPSFFATLKMGLFNDFVQNYFTRPEKKLAKAIFFMWPGEGKAHRRDVDDRSIIAGERFTEKNLFSIFTLLSKALNDEGRSLNLIVHSFGHQLLNGMLNPRTGRENIPDKTIFKNVFLMAPDITHLVAQDNFVDLSNFFQDSDNRKSFIYDFRLLNTLATNVHVFHDDYDFLLYVSTKKFVGGDRLRDANDTQARIDMAEKYRNLGNYGDIAGNKISNFNFVEVRKLLKFIDPAESLKFPFKFQKQKHIDLMNKAREEADYDAFTDLRILFSNTQLTSYHRYLYTCEAVVDKVLALL